MRRTTLMTLAALAISPLAAVATAPAASAAPTCDGKTATIVVPLRSGFRTDPVVGTPGDDVIVGTKKWDEIDGAGGNDTICGLGGADTLSGGEGDDRLFGGLDAVYSPDDDYYGDRILPGPGNDYVDLGHDPAAKDIFAVDAGYWDQIAFSNAPGPVSVDLDAGTATGEGTDTIAPITYAGGIDGSPFDDTLVGSERLDYITGGAGNDVIRSLGGDDRVKPDHDTVDFYNPQPRPGDDTVDLGGGKDLLEGGYGADVISAGADKDYIYVSLSTGGSVNGGAGNDSLSLSGTGAIRGGRGDDNLSVWYATMAGLARVDAAGGAGNDAYEFDFWGASAPTDAVFAVDARAGTVNLRNAAGDVTDLGSIATLESHSVGSSRTPVEFRGTNGPDRFYGGDADAPIRAWGRGGRDKLYGGPAKDVLDGGAGRDRLDGHASRDRCLRGEVLSSCERRR